ncbi:MAG: ABC transporter ATP-binding protein [Thermoleophilia bacterium]
MKDGELKAVDDVSYDLYKGECLGIIGESACGKSVSALSIMRLIPYPPGVIVGGEIMFKGQDLLKISEEEIRKLRGNRIGMIFQEPMTSLNPVLTISRQLTETLELHRGMGKKAAAEEAVKLLTSVGIPDAEKRAGNYPHQFSGGMQQRIMIAMALACRPEVLIADEPTTSVDVTVQAQLLELLGRMRTEFGTAIILITHNLGLVARYVTRVNVMYAGRLVETGPIDAIYNEPMNPYTMGLIASVPRLDLPRKRPLYVIEGLPPNLARLSQGCAFQPRCRYAVDRCKSEKPALEEVGENHFAACFRSRELRKLVEANQ